MCGKWKRAKTGVSTTQSAFEQLTDCLDDSLIEEWTNQEHVAMEKRGDHLKIFTVTSDKRRRFYHSAVSLLMCLSTYAGGNTAEVDGRRGSAGKPVWRSVHPHRGFSY